MKIVEPDRIEERIKQSKWYGNEEVISDVGKLIRCKDCKHLYDGETTKNCCDRLMEFTQWTREIDIDPDFYCGFGEAKDGEQECGYTDAKRRLLCQCMTMMEN